MFKNIFIGFVIILIVAGIGFVFFSQTNPEPAKNTQQPNSSQVNTNNQSTEAVNKPSQPKGIPAIKAYAARQFNIPESQVTIVRSEQQQWQDICLDLPIPDYDCTKKAVSGYEVVVEIDGNQTTYRGSDDGSIIRIVKNKNN